MKKLTDNEKRLGEVYCEVDEPEAEALMRELQEVWDLHTQRIDAILQRAEAQPKGLDMRYAHSQRSKDMKVWLVLGVLSFAMGVGSAVLIGHFDLLVRTAGVVLTVVDAAVAYYCLRRYHKPRSVVIRKVTANRDELSLSIPQVTTMSAAAAVALLFVLSLPIGDGYTMTQSDRSLRAEAYTNAETILLQS